jgi:signal transduction histidine kinase
MLRKVSKNNSRDKWYFRVREMQTPFEINVDPDEANRDQRTVFVNYRVYDYRGNYIGATGVGLTLDKIGSHIDRYQSTFNRRIFFVDRNGQIVLAGKSMTGVNGSIRDLSGISSIAEQILHGGDSPKQLEYHRGRSLVMVNSRYIPELSSYLLVEQDEGEDIKGVWRVLLVNLAVGIVLGLMALAVMRRVVDRYQQRLESMARDALAHAAREIEMAREQQDFVSMVSHEFRTPIAIIDSSLQGLKRHEVGLPDEVSERYGRIRRATLRLQELIGNFLAGDRLKQVHYLPGAEDIDLFQLVARTAERVEFPRMALQTDGLSAVVAGDTELLRIVFFNILNNAVKYSPPDGTIHVEGAVKDGFVEIRIRDAGEGIAPADLPHIFEKHYRAPANKAAGSGLGLYIVRGIVMLHGGTVSADSSPGKGTTICVRLPVARFP